MAMSRSCYCDSRGRGGGGGGSGGGRKMKVGSGYARGCIAGFVFDVHCELLMALTDVTMTEGCVIT